VLSMFPGVHSGSSTVGSHPGSSSTEEADLRVGGGLKDSMCKYWELGLSFMELADQRTIPQVGCR
jgi:hypothetical protein